MRLVPTRRGLLAGALLSGSARAQGPPLVVASFSILGDLVRQVAGERVSLRVLAGPETDAHEFQPRPSDAVGLRDAALVVRNGLGFEPWLDGLLAAAGPRGRVATASAGVRPLAAPPARPPMEPRGDAFGTVERAGERDPHAWQDVANARRYAANIAAALAVAIPDQAAAWQAGAAALDGRLALLDAWVRERIGSVPPARRVFVTQHRGFGYLAEAYRLRALAVQGIAPGGEAGAAQFAALVREIRAQRITALFSEGFGGSPLMRRLAQETGVPLRGRLFGDTLSAPDGPAPGYEAMMRHNVGLLVPAMLG